MGFVNDLIPYIDQWGLVSDRVGTSSGNSIVYWAEALIIAKTRGELDRSLTGLCLASIAPCEIEPGFYKRHPVLFQPNPGAEYGSDQESIDDYAGLACIARLTGDSHLAARILAFGRDRAKVHLGFDFHFYYPNEKGWNDWDARAWLGRFPSLIASLQWGAGETPDWLTRQWWAASMKWGSVTNDNAARLARVLAYARGDRYWIGLTEARIRAEWGSMGRLYTHYLGADHAFARWA